MNPDNKIDIDNIPLGDSINVVSLECLVVLKIIQHCRQSTQSETVTGQLLGLDIKGELEITDCFPLPLRHDEEEDRGSAHAMEMMKIIRDNVDNNTVGWYYSGFLEMHIGQFLLDTQFSYQSQTNSSVVLIYDPLTTSHGTLGFRAYRLTDAFMELQKGPGFTKESLANSKFTFSDIFVNIPINIRTSFGYTNALLAQLESNSDIANQYEHFDLASNDFLIKNLEGLSYSLADLQKEQSTHDNYQRNIAKLDQQQQQFISKRKHENELRKAKGEKPLSESLKDFEIEQPTIFKKPVEPSHLESLLVAYRMDSHCDQIMKFSGKTLEKQHIVKAMHDAY
jgi:translation initiation factor 3 subunit H